MKEIYKGREVEISSEETDGYTEASATIRPAIPGYSKFMQMGAPTRAEAEQAVLEQAKVVIDNANAKSKN